LKYEGRNSSDAAAELVACWKWFGSKKSSLFEVCKGVAAELTACWNRCKGVMATKHLDLDLEVDTDFLVLLLYATRKSRSDTPRQARLFGSCTVERARQ